MKILIAGAGALLVATAAPALANGGGGRDGGQSHEWSSGSPHGLGNFAHLVGALRWSFGDGAPGFFSPGKHYGWFRGRHWGWFKPHHPHWPHDPPVSP